MLTDFDLAAQQHLYVYDPAGKVGPSVTTVLGIVDNGKVARNQSFNERQLARGLDPEDELEAYGARGHRVHAVIHGWAQGYDWNPDYHPSDEPYIVAASTFFNSTCLQVVWSEAKVVSTAGYGGTVDCIGAIQGETWLIDWKTGRQHAFEHCLQLAGYASATGIAVYDEHGKFNDIVPMPKIDHWACVYLTKHGPELVEYPEALDLTKDQAKEAWAHCLGLYQFFHPQNEREPF